ncbi:DUF2642 domain-containing protein [Shouchella sp. JSM 1781072]|uniref:DUF2642 domain-containing protein n=1 Tax=Bacillaceae TaxID=186817 RepID=UPI000C073560|nr:MULTISPECIES: DUF2642 domain-containing protein [Bacillaceae]UTR08173.1 YuzF family protein [Alkalihalobacillus sp. LMS6]
MFITRFFFFIKSLFQSIFFPACCNHPVTKREQLWCLIGREIEGSTPFGFLSGTLVAVEHDYIVLLDETNAQVLVRIAKIETVRPLA